MSTKRESRPVTTTQQVNVTYCDGPNCSNFYLPSLAVPDAPEEWRADATYPAFTYPFLPDTRRDFCSLACHLNALLTETGHLPEGTAVSVVTDRGMQMLCDSMGITVSNGIDVSQIPYVLPDGLVEEAQAEPTAPQPQPHITVKVGGEVASHIIDTLAREQDISVSIP